MKTHKIKLADVIERAAHDHLSTDQCWYPGLPVDYYSCLAVWFAAKAVSPEHWRDVDRAFEALVRSMGLHPDHSDAFSEFEAGEERQSVRFAWLMLVAQVAREEGITVEVPA